VMDYYSDTYYRTAPVRNPQGPPGGKTRVVRGGSWKSSEDELLVARRSKREPTEMSDQVGFRVVIEPVRK
jgi:formylglycine-generating enzyme required for sulfatase activity